jgi:hypothetical protein
VFQELEAKCKKPKILRNISNIGSKENGDTCDWFPAYKRVQLVALFIYNYSDKISNLENCEVVRHTGKARANDLTQKEHCDLQNREISAA